MFDISLAMNLAPVAVNASMTYTALYDMVRKCGLRHVVAVNHNNQVSKRQLCMKKIVCNFKQDFVRVWNKTKLTLLLLAFISRKLKYI